MYQKYLELYNIYTVPVISEGCIKMQCMVASAKIIFERVNYCNRCICTLDSQ